MKKRILSVFLTAAILFGAASLSALGASNKIFTGENSRYKIEGEVYKAYDELYGLTENLGNALDDKDSAKIDQSQSNWKLVCNTSYEDRPVYYKMIFNNDDNYIDIGPCVNGRDFLYKFGAILNKSSKRMIISPVYTYAFAQNVKTSTASLVFTAPKAGEVVLYDLYGDAITAMTEGPFWSFGTKDDEYHNKNGVMRADINFYRNTTLLATAQISETVHSADFPDLGKIEVAAGDTLKIEVLYKEDGSNGYGSRSERNAVSINPAVAYTKVYQESYSAYDYLNNVVEENKASIADGKVKLSPDSFKTSAPWNVTFSAPEGGNKWYSNTMYLKNSFSFNGSENVNKYAITGEAEGGKECMFVAFEDGKLVINGSYKGDVLNGYITSLNFTAPKSGNIELSSDTLTCMKDGPYWANGSVHTTTFSIKKNDSVLKTVTVNYASGNPSGWYVDGVEQAEATPVFPTVYAKVEKGDILTVEVTQGGKSNKSCAAITPIISYLENQTTESIKALAIGNSLTEEATAYLHTAFSAIGVNDIKIGAYISENALSAYADEITSDSFSLTGAYTLCDNGVSGTAEQLTLKAAAEKAEWDVVILQSSSQDLNNTEFNKTIAAIKKCFPNAKLAYYGTAVPFGDDTHYAKHTDISDKAVLNVIDSVDYYIPAGTAIENCRTSYLGNRLKISGGSIIDGFQSDNGTMSETAKLIAAMTFAEELCDQVADWKYDSFSDVIKNETEFEIVKAAVRRAVMRPYRVTQYAEDTSVTLSGDANCDGKVNICDLVRYGEFTARVNGTEVYKANCDTVKDNRLDEQDLGGIKKLLLAIG